MTEPATQGAPPDAERRARWPLVLGALVLVALGLVPTANLLSPGVVPNWGRNLRQWAIWLVVSWLLALALARLAGSPLRALLAATDRLLRAPRPRVFALAAGVATSALALAVGYLAFRLRPVSADGLAQLWQAHLLASGHLTARTPANPEFFSTIMTVDAGGRWFAQFPMGGAAVIALGVVVGAPWIVNPLLTGLAAAAFYRFIAAIDGEPTARRATVLFALSPFVLLMGGSQMNHALVLAAVTMALAALTRWMRAADARPAAALIGFALGVAATTRPYDAVIIAVPIAIFQVATMRRRPVLLRTLPWQLAAGLVPVALLLLANWKTTGSPLLFAYDLLNGPEHRPGFHVSPLWVDHTLETGLRIVSGYLMVLNAALLAWPAPAVPLMATTLLLQRRATRWDYLLLGIVAALIVGYGAYWADSYFAGPRFLYSAVPVFILLVARFPLVVRERLRGPTTRTAAALIIPLWLVLAWTLPPNRAHAYGVRTLLRLNAEKRGNGAAIERAVDALGGNVLVFVPDGWHARLAARLRGIGIRPLSAEAIVNTADACVIQTALDELESAADPTADGARRALTAILRDSGAVALPDLAASDQVALHPGRPLTPACLAEQARTRSYGVSMMELLPAMSVDRKGTLAGAVIYARDLGAANERLRAEHGGRRWLMLRVTPAADGIRVSFDPYVAASATVGVRR